MIFKDRLYRAGLAYLLATSMLPMGSSVAWAQIDSAGDAERPTLNSLLEANSKIPRYPAVEVRVDDNNGVIISNYFKLPIENQIFGNLISIDGVALKGKSWIEIVELLGGAKDSVVNIQSMDSNGSINSTPLPRRVIDPRSNSLDMTFYRLLGQDSYCAFDGMDRDLNTGSSYIGASLELLASRELHNWWLRTQFKSPTPHFDWRSIASLYSQANEIGDIKLALKFANLLQNYQPQQWESYDRSFDHDMAYFVLTEDFQTGENLCKRLLAKISSNTDLQQRQSLIAKTQILKALASLQGRNLSPFYLQKNPQTRQTLVELATLIMPKTNQTVDYQQRFWCADALCAQNELKSALDLFASTQDYYLKQGVYNQKMTTLSMIRPFAYAALRAAQIKAMLGDRQTALADLKDLQNRFTSNLPPDAVQAAEIMPSFYPTLSDIAQTITLIENSDSDKQQRPALTFPIPRTGSDLFDTAATSAAILRLTSNKSATTDQIDSDIKTVLAALPAAQFSHRPANGMQNIFCTLQKIARRLADRGQYDQARQILQVLKQRIALQKPDNNMFFLILDDTTLSCMESKQQDIWQDFDKYAISHNSTKDINPDLAIQDALIGAAQIYSDANEPERAALILSRANTVKTRTTSSNLSSDDKAAQRVLGIRLDLAHAQLAFKLGKTNQTYIALQNALKATPSLDSHVSIEIANACLTLGAGLIRHYYQSADFVKVQKTADLMISAFANNPKGNVQHDMREMRYFKAASLYQAKNYKGAWQALSITKMDIERPLDNFSLDLALKIAERLDNLDQLAMLQLMSGNYAKDRDAKRTMLRAACTNMKKCQQIPVDTKIMAYALLFRDLEQDYKQETFQERVELLHMLIAQTPDTYPRKLNVWNKLSQYYANPNFAKYKLEMLYSKQIIDQAILDLQMMRPDPSNHQYVTYVFSKALTSAEQAIDANDPERAFKSFAKGLDVCTVRFDPMLPYDQPYNRLPTALLQKFISKGHPQYVDRILDLLQSKVLAFSGVHGYDYAMLMRSQFDYAVSIGDKALAIAAIDKLAQSSLRVLYCGSNLRTLYYWANRSTSGITNKNTLDMREILVRKLLKAAQTQLNPDSVIIANLHINMADLLIAQNNLQEAQRELDFAEAILQKHQTDFEIASTSGECNINQVKRRLAASNNKTEAPIFDINELRIEYQQQENYQKEQYVKWNQTHDINILKALYRANSSKVPYGRNTLKCLREQLRWAQKQNDKVMILDIANKIINIENCKIDKDLGRRMGCVPPDSPPSDAYFLAIQACLDLKKLDLAKSYVMMMHTELPELPPHLMSEAAMMAHKVGEDALATEWLERAQLTTSISYWPSRDIVYAWRSIGRPDKAEALSKRVNELQMLQQAVRSDLDSPLRYFN